MSEKRKNEQPISFVKALFWSFVIVLFTSIGLPLAFCGIIWFFSSEAYHAIDKGECARVFQQLPNKKYRFSIPNESNIVITHENVNRLVELYRLSLPDGIAQDPLNPFDPRLIWFLPNDEVMLLHRGAARIDSDTFALYENVAFYGESYALRICDTKNGSQLDFVSADDAKFNIFSNATRTNPYIFMEIHVTQISNVSSLIFWDSNEENVWHKVPMGGYLYDTEFSEDKTTVCALTSSEFICWGIPSPE